MVLVARKSPAKSSSTALHLIVLAQKERLNSAVALGTKRNDMANELASAALTEQERDHWSWERPNAG